MMKQSSRLARIIAGCTTLIVVTGTVVAGEQRPNTIPPKASAKILAASATPIPGADADPNCLTTSISGVIRLHIKTGILASISAGNGACSINHHSCISEAGVGTDTYNDDGTDTPILTPPLPPGGSRNWNTPFDINLLKLMLWKPIAEGDLSKGYKPIMLEIVLDDPGLEFLYYADKHKNGTPNTDSSIALEGGDEGHSMFSCRSDILPDTVNHAAPMIRVLVSRQPPQKSGQQTFGGLNIGLLVPDEVETSTSGQPIYIPFYIDPKILNDG